MNDSVVRRRVCSRRFWCSWNRAMSLWATSISLYPWVIHSAIARPTPGPSLIQTADAVQSPLTSLSPRIGEPSQVSESRPLIAYRISAPSAPSRSGISS